MAKLMHVTNIKKGYWLEAEVSKHHWEWRQVQKAELDLSGGRVNFWVEGDLHIWHPIEDLVVASEKEPTGVAPRWQPPSWDEYFLDIARVVASRAKCRRRQVGAVIVDENHRIVSTGYNGHPSANSKRDCLSGGCPRGLLSSDEVAPYSSYDAGPGLCIASHAEANACAYRGREVRGGTVYVTDKPCFSCTKTLMANGVVRAVWSEGHATLQELFSEYMPH